MDNNQTPAQEAVKREMYRVSQDDCMVFNPTDEDFVVDWDGFKYIIPNKDKDMGWGKGMREVKRYIAAYYCRHMKNKLINEKGVQEGEKMIAKRRKEGKEEYTDAYVENRQVWDKVPRTDDPKLMAEIYPALFLGVVREFGLEFSEEERKAGLDTRSQEEIVMEELQKKKFVPSSTTAPMVTDSKEKLAKEVTT